MSVLAKADFFHTREYIHIQLANSNIVKTSDLSRKKHSGSGKWGGSEILDRWDYRRNRLSFNFVFLAFIRAGIPAEFLLVPCYKSPHRHSERDPDRCPVRISAGTCENTGVHSRGKWHQRARLLCLITNHFIHSQIYEDGTIEQPFLTRNWVLSLSVITV